MTKPVKLDTYRLAMLPLAYLAEQEELFEQCGKRRGVTEAYRDIFILGIWAYQLHVYLDLVRGHFGLDARRRVWAYQRKTLDQEGGAGQLIERAFRLIEIALELGDKSTPDPLAGEWLSRELAVAVALLFGMPESPDYHGDALQLPCRVTRTEQGPESKLRDCLCQGHRRIRHVFESARW